MIRKLFIPLIVVMVLAGCAQYPILNETEGGISIRESVDTSRSGPYIKVYEHADFKGRSRVITGNQENLWWTDRTMNDKITSIEIFNHARVNVFEHANGRGESLMISANHNNLFWTHMNDKITSIYFY